MDERLRLVRLTPDQILDAGCGAGAQLSLLHARYPLARILGQDHNPGLLKLAQQRAKKIFPHGWREWLSRLRGHPPATAWIQTDLAHSGLQPESIDLVWSNLALHWHPAPHEVLQEWGRIIRPNGLVFFSCFGPATMQELRQALTTAGLTTATPNFVDMHDFGDLLIEKGFADPVMDQEVLTLTYPSAEKLLQDVKILVAIPRSVDAQASPLANGGNACLMRLLCNVNPMAASTSRSRLPMAMPGAALSGAVSQVKRASV